MGSVTRFRWLWVVVAAACSREAEAPRTAAPVTKAADAAPSAALPDARPREPKFAARLGREQLPAAPPPTTAPVLRWALEEGKAMSYDYQQDVESEIDGKASSMTGAGTLRIVGRGGDSFDLVGKDMVMKVDGKDSPPQSFEIERVRLNGDATPIESGNEWTIQVPLLLPGRALAQGERSDVSLVIPMRVGRGQVKIDLIASARLTGYVSKAGKTLAKIETSAELARREPDSRPAFAVAMSMRGVLLYDPSEQALDSAEVAVSQDLHVKHDDGTTGNLRQDHFARLARRSSIDARPVEP
jgi:hypothetical protein